MHEVADRRPAREARGRAVFKKAAGGRRTIGVTAAVVLDITLLARSLVLIMLSPGIRLMLIIRAPGAGIRCGRVRALVLLWLLCQLLQPGHPVDPGTAAARGRGATCAACGLRGRHTPLQMAAGPHPAAARHRLRVFIMIIVSLQIRTADSGGRQMGG